MNIVVLDGYTLNPGDLTWDGLRALGACSIFDRTPSEEIVERARAATVLLTNKTPLRREHLRQLPQLKYVGVLATGYNIVDVAAAQEQRVLVTNVPAYGTRSVAQMTLALMLELALHVGAHAQSTRQGDWSRSPDFCYWHYPLIELEGQTLGIIGFGRIGRAVADLGRALGMEVLAFNPRSKSAPPGVRFVDLPGIFAHSDFLSLHCPLTDETRHIVNRETLARMKPEGFLINTSRGPLIDEAALAEALNAGRLAGAALDVLSVEPPAPDNPLLQARNCLVTPHIAWATRAARARLLRAATENVRQFLAGTPQNVVA